MNYDKVKVGNYIVVEFLWEGNITIREGIVKGVGIDTSGPYAGRDVIKYDHFVVFKDDDDKNIIKHIYTLEESPEYFI